MKLALLFIPVAFLSSCTTHADLHSAEVAVYDDYVRAQDPQFLLKRLVKRADEPYILAGEDVEGLVLSTRSLIVQLGDKRFSQEMEKLTPRERSAVRLFLKPTDLGANYPRTKSVVLATPQSDDWACLQAEKLAAVARDGTPM